MKSSYKIARSLVCGLAIINFSVFHEVRAQESPKEEDFFKIFKMPIPEGNLLEVGGLVTLPDGNLAISTRRGNVYIVENPTSKKPYFKTFATGLHEVLGLAWKNGSLYCAQRGELTKLTDTNMDGKADSYETVYSWPLSGHYHEYSFGPKIAPDGSFFVTGNVAFGSEEWWRGESRVPWRGWAMNITENGNMTPWATGMRSPCGVGMLNGEFFYTDNQGDYFGSGGLWQVKKGDFLGHPAGLVWTGLPNSPLKLSKDQFDAILDERKVKNEQGKYVKPQNVVDEKFVTRADLRTKVPALRLPAVWLPHGILGVSNSEPIVIPPNTFGPFSGQVLVGDQGMSIISRVFLEKINGEYQGAAFAFRSGFRSGVLRMEWAPDGSLFVGETDRGWGSVGDATEGLQRLVYNGGTPFEMKAVRAMPDGFELEFTLPVERESANDLASYGVESFTYKYHPVYGSPPVNSEKNPIKGVKVSADGLKVRLVVDNMRKYFIHTITAEGIRDKEHFYSLVHPTAFYTLNNIPDGEKLAVSELSTKNTAAPIKAKGAPTTKPKLVAPKAGDKKVSVTTQKPIAAATAPTFAMVKGILAKYTCLACHDAAKKQVGPPYVEVAKRKYSNEKIVQLIHNPQPENWPGYATEMPPMPQVPKSEAMKIAAWINSLK